MGPGSRRESTSGPSEGADGGSSWFLTAEAGGKSHHHHGQDGGSDDDEGLPTIEASATTLTPFGGEASQRAFGDDGGEEDDSGHDSDDSDARAREAEDEFDDGEGIMASGHAASRLPEQVRGMMTAVGRVCQCWETTFPG